MRKFLSLILLIVVLLAGEGWYLSFIYLQHTVREEAEYEIRKGLKDEDLTLIVVTPGREQEITWTKKDREFRYRGSMYDVVRIKVRDGKKYYYCLNDVKEKEIIADFSRSHKKHDKTLQNLQEVFSNKYLPEGFSIQEIRNSFLIAYSGYRCFYRSRVVGTESPPPKPNL